MADNHAEFIVLGAGPGGYACAFRAADLGREVVLVDPRASLGGVCLNEGCIPSKALLHAAELIRDAQHSDGWGISTGNVSVDIDKLRARKDGIVAQLTAGLSSLAERRNVRIIRGEAAFTGPKTLDIDGDSWTFEQAVIAVGSAPVQLPGWPADNRIWDSSAALELRKVPKRLAIVGGGIIGLEMATVYAALGARVVVIEFMEQIAPGVDFEAVKVLHKALESQGVTIHTRTKVSSVKATKTALTLSCEGMFSGDVKVDAAIQAVGRRASGGIVNADAAGVTTDEKGVIVVDSHCQTNIEGIFAVGDVTGNPMVAHRATYQGHVAAEVASGHAVAFETTLIPSVAYTNPELAWVGLNQGQAKEQDITHEVVGFPWSASGRNLASGSEEGFTKLVYCPNSHRLLGATLVGQNAGELLSECVLAIEMGATLKDIALTVHAHPTLSETIQLATERALGSITDL
ncbi:dihydrolipoyl dehydrogenase [Ruegeria atlantica]|uniref:dihydrolipoyl dehydrogenase n=1 Tax=Ruegeria atlantica TaxID=81569 RepID=UPI00147DB31A|nr:dihydrolipoyl dehydrogenase [Ruegeria atlantica]